MHCALFFNPKVADAITNISTTVLNGYSSRRAITLISTIYSANGTVVSLSDLLLPAAYFSSEKLYALHLP